MSTLTLLAVDWAPLKKADKEPQPENFSILRAGFVAWFDVQCCCAWIIYQWSCITFTLLLNWYLKVMETNIVYHSYDVAAVRDPGSASVSQQMFGLFPQNDICVYWCYWINRLYFWPCSPLHLQTTRSRDRSESCREGRRCKTRPGRMIPNQGKRMTKQGRDAKLEPVQHPLTGSSAWFISPALCWGGTIMVIMMNRAIWMLPSCCVICELCATHRLVSSQNVPARTQLGSWSYSGALPSSYP